ncbi:ATP-dependent helicase [Salmonella enterica subsp. enterica serovar Minnesota]|nr:ATP-dependent helicase [Salmonella enterica subsp. enterica serovar Minnesota]
MYFSLEPDIKIDGQNVHITGLSFHSFEKDLQKLYGTSTIGNYMFVREKWDTIRTNTFFLVELHFCISKLLQLRNIRSNRKRLSQLKEKLETETWLEGTFNPHGKPFDVKKVTQLFNFKPFEPQSLFLAQYPVITQSYNLTGLLLDAKAGSGKTFLSLMWSKCLDNLPTIVLCPLGIVDSVWTAHMHKAFKEPPKYWTSISGQVMPDDADYYIMHYDYAFGNNFQQIVKKLKEIMRKRRGKFKLVVDECHNFNEFKTGRTQRLIEMHDEDLFSHCLPMSGTPLKALGREAYTVFCLIDPLFKGRVREKFLEAYGRSRDKLNELLNHRIGRSKFTISSLNNMEDAPPVEPVKVSFPGSDKFTLNAIRHEMQLYITDRIRFYNNMMPEFLMFFQDTLDDYQHHIKGNNKLEAELSQYRKIVIRFRREGFTTWNKEDVEDNKFCKRVEEKIEARLRGKELHDFRSIKSAVKYLNLKLQGEALGNVLGKARMAAIRETIRHAGLVDLIRNAEKKTLIFTSYVEVVKETEKYLAEQGIRSVCIYGENNKNRDQLIAEFEADPNIEVCIAVYNSLKEGYPMLMANNTIFMNAPFRDYELTQAIARTHRVGQDAPCFFWMVDLDTGKDQNITSRSIDILEWSREQVDQLLSKQEGHVMLGEVAGNEIYDMSFEPPCQPLRSSSSILTLF